MIAGGGGGGGGADDGALVAAAQGGDRAALERLLRSHEPQLHAVCRRMTGNDADAADACQEALVALVRGLPRFDRRARFSTWAYRVAVNASIDELRRRGRRPQPVRDDALADRVDGAGGGSLEPAPPGRSAAASDLHLDVDAALRRLPLEFRAPVVLRDLCGLDYAEIAEVLGLPAGTVRSRISRGRAALVPFLGAPSGQDGGGAGNPPARRRRPTPRPPRARTPPTEHP